MTHIQDRKGTLARNVLLNIFGQIIPLIIGIISIPFVVQSLGVEKFGILSLAWMLFGYFTIFDLGLGRATTKFIAAEIKNGATDNLRNIFWTSSLMNFFLGFIGGLVIAGMASFLAESVFRIPMGLIQTTKTTFFILAISCPIILVSLAFRGTLEAAQRFEYVNAVSVISSSLSFLLPLIGILTGLDLEKIIFLLMVSRLGGALAYLLFCFKVFPILKNKMIPNIKQFRQLLSFGGWVSVSNLVNPVLSYLDRFFIGSIISIAAVAFYTAPYEMVTRLSILPMSFAMTLFPSFSAVDAAAREGMASLYSRSVKFLLILMGPLVVVLILFAGEILHLWLGFQFAEISTLVMQILAVGILMNSMAQIPYALIQGFGRPDITAKLHMLELLLYVPLVWFLVKNMGIVGGALAWTIRVTIDSLLLFVVSSKYINFQVFHDRGLKRCIYAVIILMFILFGVFMLNVSIIVRIAITGAAIIVFIFTSWRFILERRERELIMSTALHFVSVKK